MDLGQQDRLAVAAQVLGVVPADFAPPNAVDDVLAGEDQAPAQQPEAGKDTVEDVEDKIADVWESVLGTTDFGYGDPFFDVGGDSFQLPIVRAELEKAIEGCEVTVMDLLKYPTIAALAAHLHRAWTPAR
jgi:hypothetical protein